MLREETLERQKALGVVPADCELSPRHAEIPAWDDMPEQLKPVLRRQMEVYAGFLEHTDHQIGRLVDALAELDALENTLVLYILGDNGASAEGTINGTYNELLTVNGFGALETPEYLISRLDELGGPSASNHYRGRLGACDEHAVSVDEAGRLALGRHPQRPGRALAERHHGQR